MDRVIIYSMFFISAIGFPFQVEVSIVGKIQGFPHIQMPLFHDRSNLCRHEFQLG